MNTHSAAAFNTRLSARIETLSSKLHTVARSVEGTLSEYTADDLFQTICLKLTERCTIDPAFLDRPAAEWITFANWRARSKADSGRRYTRYIDSETLVTDDDGEEDSLFDSLPSPTCTNPEDSMIQMEVYGTLKAHLSESNLKLVNMLYQGYSQQEIAAELGICESAVAQRKQTIARQLAQVLA